MKIQQSHLKALLSVCENDQMREYKNQICINKHTAYASNGYIGIAAFVSEPSEGRKALKASAVNLESALQESKLKYEGNKPASVKTALITLDNVQPEDRPYPPIEHTYEMVESQKDKTIATYDLDQLIILLKAIKASCVAKSPTVTLQIGNVNKPMLITVQESGINGIIVPSRK